MIDYHLHLWPHGHPDSPMSVEEIASYCEKANMAGVAEIALTEHIFRFRQTEKILGDFFLRYPESKMRGLMFDYWHQHSRADMDEYFRVVQEAKDAGLPVVAGLEVDYYPGEMDKVAALISEYPLDVALGSVHWIDDWPFDHISDPFVMEYWNHYGVERAWGAYTTALEELAQSGVVDVLAHPDLIKVAGHFPSIPDEFFDRMAQAAASSGVAAEVSSAGIRKPVGEAYPAPSLLAKFFELAVPITTASDSHGIEHVGFQAAEIKKFVTSAGYNNLLGFKQRRPYEVEI